MLDIERRAKEESFHKIRDEDLNSSKKSSSKSDHDDESGIESGSSCSTPFSENEFLTLNEAKRLLDQKDILIAKHEEKLEKAFETNHALTMQVSEFKRENHALHSK